MRFADPEWLLWLWALIPAAAALLLLFLWRKITVRRLSGSESIRNHMLGEVSFLKKGISYIVLLTVFGLALLSLSRPQWGIRMENVVQRGVDVLIAVDTSLSMDTPDITPSRLDKAKEELISLIEQLEEARIGVITFAGTAFSQCPLTIDRTAARMFIEILDSGLIPEQGTDLGKAIALARDTFLKHQRKYKVLILITDGENLEGDPFSEATRASDEGVIIYTIGIGTPAGQPIPIVNDRNEITGYKKDISGEPVISRLDEATLVQIARIGGGQYYRATQSEIEVGKIVEDIQSMEKKELQSKMLRQYLERFQIPLFLAIVLLGAEIFISDRKRMFRRTLRRFRRIRDGGWRNVRRNQISK
jgi:Ca-activated chloride channel family protein